jgi:RNA polymerase sigma-70 factor (ECF subfamily)
MSDGCAITGQRICCTKIQGCDVFHLEYPDCMPSTEATEEPWHALYEQLAPRLLLFARQYLPSTADAEDVMQTAFIRCWRKYPEAKSENVPLLYAAVRNAALDLIRSNGRRALREESFHAVHANSGAAYFEGALDQQEEADRVQAALQRLPAEQRETLVLRIWGELTFAEIAATLGESINTVAARHRYALEALRRVLKPHEHERVRV